MTCRFGKRTKASPDRTTRVTIRHDEDHHPNTVRTISGTREQYEYHLYTVIQHIILSRPHPQRDNSAMCQHLSRTFGFPQVWKTVPNALECIQPKLSVCETPHAMGKDFLAQGYICMTHEEDRTSHNRESTNTAAAATPLFETRNWSSFHARETKTMTKST